MMNEALTKKIKSLKPMCGFYCTPLERVRVLQLARALRNLGQIDFDLVTKKNKSGKFRVAAMCD